MHPARAGAVGFNTFDTLSQRHRDSGCLQLGLRTGRGATLITIRAHAAEAFTLDAACVNVVTAHVQRTADWWYQRADPFLTPEREAHVRAAWAQCAAAAAATTLVDCTLDGETPLPIDDVYGLVFTPLERTELSLHDFTEDIREFCATHEGGGGDRINLDTTLRYLQQAQ
eukprot:4072659-Pleurochrysis_carterae.AAC.5